MKRPIDSSTDKIQLKNYYEFFGVEHDASVSEINNKFRQIARLYHPDSMSCHTKYSFLENVHHGMQKRMKHQNGSKMCTKDIKKEMFNLICKARDVLVDPEKRVQYNLKIFGEERRKWKGSIERKLEDLFYQDIEPKRKKKEMDYIPPIIIRKELSLCKWLQHKKPFTVTYNRKIVCAKCNGYCKIPIVMNRSMVSILTFVCDWDEYDYTQICANCNGNGSLLFDLMGNEKDFTQGINAKMIKCYSCNGKKRVFNLNRKNKQNELFKILDCRHCDGNGNVEEQNVKVSFPLPFHFDVYTKTSVVVLLNEGNKLCTNREAGDVHIIFELKIPRYEIYVFDKNLKIEDKINEHDVSLMGSNPSEYSEEQTTETDSEEPSEISEMQYMDKMDTCKPKQNVHVLDDLIFSFPLILNSTNNGYDIMTSCKLSLRQAICGFTLKFPKFWECEESTIENSINLKDILFSYDSKSGQTFWEKDKLTLLGAGPKICELCSNPPFVCPKTKKNTKPNENLMFDYLPIFAPCLVLKAPNSQSSRRKQKKDKWTFVDCVVSRSRYITQATNITKKKHNEKTVKIDDSISGNFEIAFTIKAPESSEILSNDFYQTFARCCEGLDHTRNPINTLV